MYLSYGKFNKAGKRKFYIQDQYRVNGKKVTVTLEKLGYEQDFKGNKEDIIPNYKKKMNIQPKVEEKPVSFLIDANQELYSFSEGEIVDTRKSLGASALSIIYHQLGLDVFIRNRSRALNSKYDINAILKLIVYSRILFPGSKLHAYKHKGSFFEKMDFKLGDIYLAMDNILSWQDDILSLLNDKIKKHYNRDTQLLYYDVTNYYFEIEDNDEDLIDVDNPNYDPNNFVNMGKRKKGYSKEGRKGPLVQMGLLMDDKGIPVAFKTFPGNYNDVKTMIPMMGLARMGLEMRDIVYVGDKGMMSANNIARIISQKNGYVLSYALRGADEEFKKYVVDQNGYRYEEITEELKQRKEKTTLDDKAIIKIKSIMRPREIEVSDIRKGKSKVIINERVIIFYSEKYAKRAKKKRENTIRKAQEYVAKNKRLPHSFGMQRFVDERYINKDGELLKTKDFELLFDQKKLEKDEALDGYYVIFTNVIGRKEGEKPFKGKSRFLKEGLIQLNKQVKDTDIIKMYRGLWEIEETFKVTKSGLSMRPVYHRLNGRIDCHFLLGFISLIIVRLLEQNLESKYSTEEILKSLRAANGSRMARNYYHFDFRNHILDELDKKIGTCFKYEYRTVQQIRKIFSETKKR